MISKSITITFVSTPDEPALVLELDSDMNEESTEFDYNTTDYFLAYSEP